MLIERCSGAGRDHARGVVLLDDRGARMWRGEIGPVDDRSLAPAEVGSEVDAPRAAATAEAIDAQRVRDARPIRHAETDHPQAHDLHGLVLARAMPVRALVLAPERLLDALEERGVERTGRD